MQGEAHSKYIGRWSHRLALHFRVWPKWKLAHDAIKRETDFPINAMRIGEDGAPELWHQIEARNAHVFEISDEDFDVIGSIPKAGARRMRGMAVRAPGTLDSRVKMECWVEVPVIAYAKAPERIITPWGRKWNRRSPHEIFGETPEDALGLAGMGRPKIVFIEKDDDIDGEMILREVLENDAMIVLNRRKSEGGKSYVSVDAGNRLVQKAMFWTVPGRRPWEDGGALRGYQFADRIVRWSRQLDPENRAAARQSNLEKMHEASRAKGRSNRRQYFLDNTVNRFAERVGMSRQRVVSKFLGDGVVDWLMRSVDNVKPILFRETSAILRGRVTDAVNALEFYYRATESIKGEERT